MHIEGGEPGRLRLHFDRRANWRRNWVELAPSKECLGQCERIGRSGRLMHPDLEVSVVVHNVQRAQPAGFVFFCGDGADYGGGD